MYEKSTRIAWFSLGVSALTFMYSFYTSEIGPIIGKPELQISVSSNINIENTANGIIVFPDIEILNTGKVSAKVGRMQIFIMLNAPNSTSRKILSARTYIPQNEAMTIGSFQIRPGYLWKAKVMFGEDFTEDTLDNVTNLDFRIASYMQKQAIQVGNKDKEIPISKDLYKELKTQITDQSKWLEPGEYRLLLNIFGGDDDKELLFQKGYKFRISSEVIKGLKEYQLDSYMYPPKISSNNNIFLTYIAKPPLTELTEEDLSSLIKM